MVMTSKGRRSLARALSTIAVITDLNASSQPDSARRALCSDWMDSPNDESPRPAAYCEIVWWRGYVNSRFVARREDGALVAESRPFRWSRAAPPPITKRRARRAYERLIESLEAEGWRAVDDGELWFETGFEQYRPQ